jgi:hypothetical protein
LGLSRPECWPFLVLYGGWVWLRHPRLRPAVVASAVTIPMLWFGGDWWGSGDPWTGAAAAQVDGSSAVERFVDAVGVMAALVVIPVWAAAAVAVASAVAAREPAIIGIAGVALAWSAVVVGMATVLGYAALSRFFLPAAALVCVLAGVGSVRLVGYARKRWLPVAVGVVVVAVVSAGQVVGRVSGLGDVAGEVRARTLLYEGLPAVIAEAGGASGVLACGSVAVEGATLLQPMVAWELDVPLSHVRTFPEPGPVVAMLISGAPQDLEVTSGLPAVRSLARSSVWAVLAIDCAEPPDASAAK